MMKNTASKTENTARMMGNTACVDVVIGLQWGSEGKGKICAYLSSEYKAMVRSGGPQAGHTFYSSGVKYVNRQVPCGVLNTDCSLYISPAALVNPDVLIEEIRLFGLSRERLIVDAKAMVVTEEHIRAEQDSSLKKRLASTCEGVGAALVDKIWRTGVIFRDYSKDTFLQGFCGDSVENILSHVSGCEPVLLEGTQGFGLSLNQGDYPFVTSKDITASALLSDSGIAPRHHRKTIGVLRTYPIRVGGNSGPTGSNELSWEDVQKKSGSPVEIREYTTVTRRLRRVFEQDFSILDRAILVNRPDMLALMFIDYIDAEDFGKKDFRHLSHPSRRYIDDIEERFGVPVSFVGTGPLENHLIDRR